MLGLLTLAGCTSTPNTAKPDDPDFAPVYGESEPVSVRPTGAIFQPEQVNGIYSDIKAHRVGDIITIQLAESTSASKKANTQSGKDNKLALDPVTLGGVPVGGIGFSDSCAQRRELPGRIHRAGCANSF